MLPDPALSPKARGLRTMFDDFRRQLSRHGRVLLRFQLIGLGLFTLVLALKIAFGIPAKFFLYDHVELDELLPLVDLPASFAGFVSSLGIVLWGVAAGLSLFINALLDDRVGGTLSNRLESRRFFLGFSFVSMLLLADDLLTLHELVGKHTMATEAVAQGVLALLVLGFLLRFRSFLLAGEWGVLVLALGLFAGSVVLDVGFEFPGKIVIEDTLKFFGILNWVAYVVLQGRSLVAEPGSPA